MILHSVARPLEIDICTTILFVASNADGGASGHLCRADLVTGLVGDCAGFVGLLDLRNSAEVWQCIPQPVDVGFQLLAQLGVGDQGGSQSQTGGGCAQIMTDPGYELVMPVTSRHDSAGPGRVTF